MNNIDPTEPKSVREVLEKLAYDAGVLAIRNESEGSTIVDEAVLAIEKLITDARVEELHRVPNDMVFDQCRIWLHNKIQDRIKELSTNNNTEEDK